MKKINLTLYKKIKEYNRIYGKPCSQHAMSKFKVSKTTLHRIATSKSHAEYLGKTRTKKVVEPQKMTVQELLVDHHRYIKDLYLVGININERVKALEAKNEDKDS